MSNVAFIGDIDLISGFGTLGAAVFGVEKKEEIPLILEDLLKEEYKVIFILEKWARLAWDIIERYKERFPSIVIIPDYRADFGISSSSVKDAIIEAVGADIF